MYAVRISLSAEDRDKVRLLLQLQKIQKKKFSSKLTNNVISFHFRLFSFGQG